MTRLVLISGKGGVGKTTVAAATAVRAAELGQRTLVISVDRAHNLGDVLGVALGASATAVPGVAGLEAMEADPQEELRHQWGALSGYLARLLAWAGLGGAEADEVAVFPGLEELLVLSRLAETLDARRHDLVVVDLAPTASSLRLLSFPELMAGPLGRMIGWERSVMRVLRPALKRVTAAPMPDEATYRAIDQIAQRLARLRAVLTDPARAVVRLVSIPERVVIDETRSAFSLMALFGLTVDAVVLNRVLPPEAESGYFAAWTRIQARELARARELFATASIAQLRFQPDEVTGPAALAAAARELYGERDPGRPLIASAPVQFHDHADGVTVLALPLPHVGDAPFDLLQRGDDLIVTLGGWRRQLALPVSLRGRVVREAHLTGAVLHVHFEPREEPR